MAKLIKTAHSALIDDQTIALGGGTSTLISEVPADTFVEVTSVYVRQTVGALRKYQLEKYNGSEAFAESDNDAQSSLDVGKSGGGILLNPGESLRVNAVAAADQATFRGSISYFKYST